MSIAGEQAHSDGDDAGRQRAEHGDELEGASNTREDESVRHPGRQKYGPPHDERDQSQQEESADVLTQQDVKILGDAPPRPSIPVRAEAPDRRGGESLDVLRGYGLGRAAPRKLPATVRRG